MIIPNVQVSTKTNIQNPKAKRIKIPIEKMGKIAKHLTENLYSNEIGSIVREYVSNAYDAHIDKAKSDFKKKHGRLPNKAEVKELSDNMTPIHVKIDKDSQGTYFAIRDFGLGMPQWAISKYFENFGESSKEDTNDELGAWGIGSKSFQVYTEIVYYKTINDGIERNFAMIKTEEFPDYLPLGDDKISDEESGTTVKMYINESDVYKFILECKRQLLYFKKVFFDIEGFNNNYKIFEGKHFLYSNTQALSKLHAVLGVVAYPIDFEKVDLPDYMKKLPIGVKFDVGDFGVNLSREAIKYTEETVNTIKLRVEGAVTELLTMYGGQTKERIYDTLLEYAEKYVMGRHELAFDDNNRISLDTNLLKWGEKNKGIKIQPVSVKHYKGIDFTYFKNNSGLNYLVDGIVVNHKINRETGRVCKVTNNDYYRTPMPHIITYQRLFDERYVFYWTSGDKPTVHQSRFVNHVEEKPVLLLKHTKKKITDYDLKRFAMALGYNMNEFEVSPKEFHKSLQRAERIFAKMRVDILKMFNVIQDIKLSKEDIEMLKEKYISSSSRGGSGRIAGNMTLYKFESSRYYDRPTNAESIAIEDLKDHYKDCTVVYCLKGSDEAESIGRLRLRKSIFNLVENVQTVAVTKTNLKHFEKMENAKTLDEFLNSKAVTDIKANYFNSKILNTIFDYGDEYKFQNIDNIFGSDFYGKYHRFINPDWKVNNIKELVGVFELEPMKDFFEKYPKRKYQKYFDECLELKKILSKFDFLKYFNTREEGFRDFIKEWMEFKKITV